VSYPKALNGQMSLLGGSPDARRLCAPHMQGLGQGLGHTQLGMSPSGGGRPLSLGGSPSHQFSAPGPPHFQASPGSQYAASPGSQYQTSSGTFGLHFACSQVLFCWLSVQLYILYRLVIVYILRWLRLVVFLYRRIMVYVDNASCRVA